MSYSIYITVISSSSVNQVGIMNWLIVLNVYIHIIMLFYAMFLPRRRDKE